MLDPSHLVAVGMSLACSVAIGAKGKNLELPYWQQGIGAFSAGWLCALIGWLA
jgi:hypothetical protein